jgi:hypothetical protein
MVEAKNHLAREALLDKHIRAISSYANAIAKGGGSPLAELPQMDCNSLL